jgi:hypothetical protein
MPIQPIKFRSSPNLEIEKGGGYVTGFKTSVGVTRPVSGPSLAIRVAAIHRELVA